MEYYLNVGEDNDGWYVAKGHEQIMFGLTEENATEVCSLFKTIEQLQARVAELEAENARLNSEIDTVKQVDFPRKVQAVSDGWKKKLADAQAEIKRLRDALEYHQEQTRPIARTVEALAQPSDTRHLDAYVAEKVKEYQKHNGILGREVKDLTRQRDNLKQQAECHAMEARTANSTLNEIYQLVSGATGEKANWNGSRPVREKLESLTRQRDLTVEALERQLADAKHCQQVMCNEVGIGFLDVVTLSNSESVLSTIKESEEK